MSNLEETFEYDSQNRLKKVWLGLTLTGASVYDSYGRMTAKPHAMNAATTVAENFPQVSQTVTYTGFDKVCKIKQGNDSLCYTYGYDRQRVFMEEHVGNKVRTKRNVGSCEYVAYGLKDNLGSWTTITDENGEVQQRLNYDAWGNLRNPSTWANYTVNDTYEKPLFDRGYTGHEHLSSFGLVNMNGRMYDPLMSAFLSPDRYVQDPMSAQGFNRYAYCLYNPLRYIDPSGWLAGSGGPSYPINTVTIEGQLYIVLPEFTVTSTPILDNEFVYTPYYGGSRGDQWDFDNSRPSQDGGGAGGGNHGGSSKNTTPDPNINIEIASKLLISANVYTSIESSLYFNRLTRTWRDKMDIFRSFDFNGNGSTGGKISYGEMMSVKYQKASSWLNGIGIGLSTIQMASAESIDDKIQYGSDLVFGMIGYAPGGGIISTFWFLGGRELVFQYGETMGLLLEDGINPGYPVYQPFKLSYHGLFSLCLLQVSKILQKSFWH